MTRRYIQRHSLLTRVTHGVAAISCILLALTGLFVFWPELGGSIMGGDFTRAMRELHRWIAIPFILVPLFAVLKSPKGFVHLFKEDVFGKWDKDDFEWAMKFPFYLFAPGKVHMPPQHHVKSAQRLADGQLDRTARVRGEPLHGRAFRRAAPQLFDHPLAHCRLVDARGIQRTAGRVVLLAQHREQQVLAAHIAVPQLARRRLRTAQHMLSLQAEFPVIHCSTLRFLFVLSFLTGLFKNKRRK